MRWTIEEQIAEADKVLTRFVWTGTQNATSLAFLPRGCP
jgi:hypothetical protein